MSTGWASGGPRSRVRAPQHVQNPEPDRSPPDPQLWMADRAGAISAEWAPTAVISLAVTGVSDTALRDVGVLGLAVCLTGCRHQRLVLRG